MPPIIVSSRPDSIASQAGHWYTREGAPAYTVIGANGKERATTIRDARKLALLPSVTTVLKAASKPGLERWKAEQLLMAALTLPPLPAESEGDWISRVWEDSIQQAVKAAQRGTEIHAAIEAHFSGGSSDPALDDYVHAAAQALIPLGPQTFHPEKSFASPLGYAGKVDLHSDLCVIDFKTKDGLDGVKLYDEHAMQLAAYAHGLGRPSARCGIVFVSRLHPGEAKLIMLSEDEQDHGWRTFKALLAYWHEAHEYSPTWSAP